MKPRLRVVQCWDDGNASDVRLMEILERHGAKATFNLNPSQHGTTRRTHWLYRDQYPVDRLPWNDLPKVYEGFTIANHTLTHPAATQIPLEDWRREVVDGRKRLQDHFQQPVWGFVYPFGDHSPETARVVAEAGHRYARTVRKATPCFPASDPFQAPTDGHFADDDFWERYERAKREASAFWFWGHSYELVTEEDWSKLESQTARITADSEVEWADLPDLWSIRD